MSRRPKGLLVYGLALIKSKESTRTVRAAKPPSPNVSPLERQWGYLVILMKNLSRGVP
jgi:hypothetical protein